VDVRREVGHLKSGVIFQPGEGTEKGTAAHSSENFLDFLV